MTDIVELNVQEQRQLYYNSVQLNTIIHYKINYFT